MFESSTHYACITLTGHEQQVWIVECVMHPLPVTDGEMRNIELLHRVAFSFVQQNTTGLCLGNRAQRSRQPFQLDTAVKAVDEQLGLEQVQMKARVRDRIPNQNTELKTLESS